MSYSSINNNMRIGAKAVSLCCNRHRRCVVGGGEASSCSSSCSI